MPFSEYEGVRWQIRPAQSGYQLVVVSGNVPMSNAVPLSGVPEQLLDHNSRNEILSFAGRRQTAHELLDAPSPARLATCTWGPELDRAPLCDLD